MLKKYLGRIFGMFSDDIGIDLGTSNTLICVKNKGIILNEPSVVAIQSKTKEIYEVGERAKLMIGRTPQAYETIRPLKNGVIADYEITEKMLNSFYRRISNRLLYNPRVIICVPAGITQVEKRAVIDVTREAGAREAFLVEEPMAAAIGIGINVFEPEGSMIVDIGGGTAELAVISLGGVVRKSSFRVAGDKFDADIIEYIRQTHNLLIGEKTAEDIKKAIGTVMEMEEDLSVDVSGRSLLNGLPKDVKVYSSELIPVLNASVQEIIEEIKVIFEKTPPELAADIRRRGIFITGGGALLRGIDQRMAENLNLKVVSVENPLNAVIDGITILLKNFNIYKSVLISTETDY
ncbi:cell division protein FtsA [Fusobacterium necrophorum subsp. funduliforme ATCC 51357]|mgnify:FL=1|uniref:Cell shape-determining protein MreB n=2 Tax=Fusobacterium necrophorum TaxID=859 RepID=A0AB73BUX5_9FUSO|nr:rod shape-determining protein [Fusobacterium necrophorum]AYZ72989.1 rod shape-determining protein [Fusobacterium necrophorum]AZW09012.1 rod shape-determining protein [Fusobacterium necrophorum subsp. necrophorum]EIJ69289.1 cell division protein FtsA [Fusobacterium necrophorum subsp. funduliforme ATCC 51357]KAB0553213.1 rod shape-determining protein [Fusobacterium necrophorum subsp. funduliforme]KDE62256.1 rod shape-determining protein Mbl [Fusobacterium necrophorum BL]